MSKEMISNIYASDIEMNLLNQSAHITISDQSPINDWVDEKVLPVLFGICVVGVSLYSLKSLYKIATRQRRE